jgi:hypothetical protein
MKTKAIEKQTSDSDFAFALFTNILDAKNEAGKQFLRIGEALTIIHEKNLYVYFNVKNFNEFIAIPELGFARSTAELFKTIYKTFIRKLGLPPEDVANIEITKLQKILPIMRSVKNKEEAAEWLGMASTLSRGDLGNTVRESMGLPPLTMKDKEHETYNPRLTESYLSYVKSHNCIVCGVDNVDAHHFPRTKGAGADDLQVIPLCRKCHAICHTNPDAFLIENKILIFNYFYRTFYEAFKIISKTTQQEV